MTVSLSATSLAYRAAEYFGVEREPRVSIPLTRPKGIAIICKRLDRTMLLLYREWPKVDGEFFALTDRQRRKLIEALQDVHLADDR